MIQPEMTNIAISWQYSAIMPNSRITTTEAVAVNLRRLMELFDMTQKQLAKKSGVSQRTVSNMLNATNEPGIEKVNAVARAFGMDGWQLQMPRLPDDMLRSGAAGKVIDAMLDATPQGREMISRLAEREAHYSKRNPEE